MIYPVPATPLIQKQKILILYFLISFLITGTPLLLQAQKNSFPKISAKINQTKNPLSPDPVINYTWANPKATDGLESYHLSPVSWSVSNQTSFYMKDFKKTNVIVVNGKGIIRFDFGRVSAGWLEFDSDDLQDKDSLTMSISEYNEPAVVNSGAVNPVKTKTPVKYGNTYRLELNPDLYEGVRFGWMNVISTRNTFHIKNLRLVCQVKPVNYRGSFASSDPELTRIWYTGAYTVKLNFQKDYLGAILMERSDRHSWTGDAYPSQAASMVAFGNYDFVKQNLTHTAKLTNDIASYSLYWVLSLLDYVNYSGDLEFAQKFIDNAIEKLDLAYAHFGKSPKLGFYGWDERLGAGFENPDIAESQNAYRMLSVRAWKEFAQLMNTMGKADLAQKYDHYATEKIEEIREKGTWLNEFGLHASADAVNTGLTTAKEDSTFYASNYTDRVNRLSYSPFNEFFILNAMSRMNRYADAISSIKDCWGSQLKQGATTFYEVYRPSWNKILAKNDAPPNNQCGYTSLTHPWSAGVVKWLSEEILGIKPLTPGFKEFEIIPHLGKTLFSVKGSTPVNSGIITADINVKSGFSSFFIPDGTMAKRIAIPLGGHHIKSVFLNDKLIWNDKVHWSDPGRSEHKKLFIKEGYLNFTDLKPGKYAVKISYKPASTNHYKSIGKTTGKTAIRISSPDSPWHYPVNTFTQDSLTSGNWKNKYGKDGYLLFNSVKNGKNQQQNPAYISAVTLRNGKNFHVPSGRENTVSINQDNHSAGNQDKRLLIDSAGQQQNFGAIITQDPHPTLQTMTIDLKLNDNQNHQLALYFLDWDNNGRRSAAEIFDLNTLKIIAPVQLIKNYQKGKYLVFNYTGSIRIRINHVRGENAALSGIFFD